jgi:hypothetical protein
MKTDAPFMRDAQGALNLHIEGGRELQYGHTFDARRGYRVAFGFADSASKNSFPANDARGLADKFFAAEPHRPLHAALHKMADQVDRLQLAWIAAGRPAKPLDEMFEGGHA